MKTVDPTSAAFFEAMYRNAPDNDPWKFAASAYEKDRYDAIVGALQGRRYRRAFEPGCSVGVLTARLAPLCDALESTDFSPTAVAVAQSRCAGYPHVTIRCEALTERANWHAYDLVVLCEIGYYFQSDVWISMVNTIATSMQPSSTLLASHWLGRSSDHVQSGDEVHAAFNHPLLECTLEQSLEGFRLQRWTCLR